MSIAMVTDGCWTVCASAVYVFAFYFELIEQGYGMILYFSWYLVDSG